MTTTTNGFAQKALIIVLGCIATALLVFCAWLATAVIEIKVNVATMKANIDSLVETRAAQTRATGERNTVRIDRLEGNSQ